MIHDHAYSYRYGMTPDEEHERYCQEFDRRKAAYMKSNTPEEQEEITKAWKEGKQIQRINEWGDWWVVDVGELDFVHDRYRVRNGE